MANTFSKEERVAFEDILEGFNDALILSRNVSVYNTDQAMMERTSNQIWRPQPYIMQSYSGMDQTSNFGDQTQLAVPATIGFQRSVPWIMDAMELRDALQEGRLGDSAKQKLASDINVSIMNVAASQSTVVVDLSTSAANAGFSAVAAADTAFNEVGVQMFDRYLGLSSRDYNGLAADLANRGTMAGKPTPAYERSYVGVVAGFETYKFDYANRIGAAAGGGSITISTLVGANNFYTPRSTSTASTGERNNVDNRYQTVTVSSTTNVAAGDAFTIAGVEAVHHITKNTTGELKTFRVMEVVNSTTMVISPPIISNQGASDAEAQYQNVEVTPSATAAIVWLNVNAAPINVFWQKDALEILPGRYAVPADSGAAVMRGTTDQGIELVMQKQYDINTMKTKYRLDTLYGVVNKQPEMSGILLFDQ
jgi:hypothetical protein